MDSRIKEYSDHELESIPEVFSRRLSDDLELIIPKPRKNS